MPTKAERIKEVDDKIKALDKKLSGNEKLRKLAGEWQSYKNDLGEKIGDVLILSYKGAFEELEK